jgi:exodeoxyribonuclease V alpha subunit
LPFTESPLFAPRFSEEALAVLNHKFENKCLVQNASTNLQESLSGLIERVTFFNEDSGFGVLKVKAKGHRELVTVVGALPSASAGEWLTAQGRWVQDREYGQQFRAEVLASTPPTTKEGIEKYLGSGMVKGIGPVCAKKLVDKFGEEVFDIIERASARLEDVDGIGPKRRKRIKDSWDEQKVIRDIMVAGSCDPRNVRPQADPWDHRSSDAGSCRCIMLSHIIR